MQNQAFDVPAGCISCVFQRFVVCLRETTVVGTLRHVDSWSLRRHAAALVTMACCLNMSITASATLYASPIFFSDVTDYNFSRAVSRGTLIRCPHWHTRRTTLLPLGRLQVERLGLSVRPQRHFAAERCVWCCCSVLSREKVCIVLPSPSHSYVTYGYLVSPPPQQIRLSLKTKHDSELIRATRQPLQR